MYSHQPIDKSFSDDERTVRELSTETVVDALRWIHYKGQNFDHGAGSVSSAFTGESIFRDDQQQHPLQFVNGKTQTPVGNPNNKVPGMPLATSPWVRESAIAEEEPEEKNVVNKPSNNDFHKSNAMVVNPGGLTSSGSNNKSDGPSSSFEWIEHLIYTIIALAIQFIFGHDYAFPDGINQVTGRACGVDDVGQHNLNMCGLETTLQQAQMQLQFLAPIVLGGYVFLTIGLWMERRAAYLALCSAVRNMNVNLASIIPPVPPGGSGGQDAKKHRTLTKRIRHARKTMARWSLLGFELSVLKARGQMDMEVIAIPHLRSMRLLEKDEWEAMVPGDRHTTVWFWLQAKAIKLGQAGVVPSEIHTQTLCNAITLVRDRANDLMSSLNRDLPFPFVSLTGILVNCFLLVNALWKGVVSNTRQGKAIHDKTKLNHESLTPHLLILRQQWSIWLYEVGPEIYTTPRMYMDILVLLVTSLLFGMLYDLSRILYNPFGDRPIDLPHAAVGGGIRKTARALASGAYLPPTMDAYDDYDENREKRMMDESERMAQQEPIDKMKPNQCGSIFAGISKKKY
jgi:Bestrophin, RFP-TM, chloride channel